MTLSDKSPKRANHFFVRFVASVSVSAHLSKAELDRANDLLTHLSAQMVSVQLPSQRFDIGWVRGSPAVKQGLKAIKTQGPVVFTFEDDIENELTHAIDLLSADSTQNIHALVMKVNDENHVLEVHFLERLKLVSVEHSKLDYADQCTVQKTLTAAPTHVHIGTFNSSCPSTETLTKKILGI